MTLTLQYPIKSVPTDLEDVSKFPNLFAALLRNGWSEYDLEKLAGKNLLRVMRQVEQVFLKFLLNITNQKTFPISIRLKKNFRLWNQLKNGFQRKISVPIKNYVAQTFLGFLREKSLPSCILLVYLCLPFLDVLKNLKLSYRKTEDKNINYRNQN